MKETKLPACQDCKHCFTGKDGALRCRLFAVKEWQAKTGAYEIVHHLRIEHARESSVYITLQAGTGTVASCGRAGRLFESKPTFMTRLSGFITKLNIMLHCALPN